MPLAGWSRFVAPANPEISFIRGVGVLKEAAAPPTSCVRLGPLDCLRRSSFLHSRLWTERRRRPRSTAEGAKKGQEDSHADSGGGRASRPSGLSAEDPKDVEGWFSLRYLTLAAGPMMRLSTLEIVSPTFPHEVRTSRFGSAACRAWCLEARRAASDGLTAIVGSDRHYPTWIAICGRSKSRPLDRGGLCDFVYDQEAAKPHEDERHWIEHRLGSCEDLTSYVQHWRPS